MRIPPVRAPAALSSLGLIVEGNSMSIGDHKMPAFNGMPDTPRRGDSQDCHHRGTIERAPARGGIGAELGVGRFARIARVNQAAKTRGELTRRHFALAPFGND